MKFKNRKDVIRVLYDKGIIFQFLFITTALKTVSGIKLNSLEK